MRVKFNEKEVSCYVYVSPWARGGVSFYPLGTGEGGANGFMRLQERDKTEKGISGKESCSYLYA